MYDADLILRHLLPLLLDLSFSGCLAVPLRCFHWFHTNVSNATVKCEAEENIQQSALSLIVFQWPLLQSSYPPIGWRYYITHLRCIFSSDCKRVYQNDLSFSNELLSSLLSSNFVKLLRSNVVDGAQNGCCHNELFNCSFWLLTDRGDSRCGKYIMLYSIHYCNFCCYVILTLGHSCFLSSALLIYSWVRSFIFLDYFEADSCSFFQPARSFSGQCTYVGTKECCDDFHNMALTLLIASITSSLLSHWHEEVLFWQQAQYLF